MSLALFEQLVQEEEEDHGHGEQHVEPDERGTGGIWLHGAGGGYLGCLPGSLDMHGELPFAGFGQGHARGLQQPVAAGLLGEAHGGLGGGGSLPAVG